MVVAEERVLVVEDTDLLRRMYRDRLTQDGYQVFEAPDGLAALNLLRDQPVDLILLDLGATDYLLKNQSRPADISQKVALTLEAFGTGCTEMTAHHVFLRPDVGDVQCVVASAGLKRMLWCPACEVELALRMVPDTDHPGHFDAYFVCTSCGREFVGLQ